MKVLLLDFDGVIVDSIDECYYTAWKAYNGLSINENEARIKELFYVNRGIVRPAYQYYYLFLAIDKFLNKEIEDIETYFFKVADAQNTESKLFEKLFFFIREQMQKDLSFWLSMHKLTDYGAKLAINLPGEWIIVTNKNRKSVELLLAFFKIKQPQIYDKEDYVKWGSKGEIINHIMKSSPQYTNGIFVDDAEEHLDAVNNEKITPMFCSLGYGKSSGKYKEFKY